MAFHLADQLHDAAEIIPSRLYFQCLELGPGGLAGATAPPGTLCYLLDNDLIYEPFCADFGPCNLAHTWRFCQRVNQLLEQVGRGWAGRGGRSGVAGAAPRVGPGW